MALPPIFDARVSSARSLSPSVRELVLERADGAPFVFEPGQWVSLVLPQDEGDLRRAYSIASPPDGSSRFELAVTRVEGGPGSAMLHEVQPGAALKAIGPQGFFTRKVDERAPSLFVATGTGVTPLRSMVRAALAAGSDAPMWLLFGLRHEEDILYREEWEELAARHPSVRVAFTLSQPGARWIGPKGYVQAHLPILWKALVSLAQERSLPEPHAYVCGLERMVGSVRQMLRKELGAARTQVHSERYD